jgi:hypothetical protein
MPYGLPGAIKLDVSTWAQSWDGRERLILPAGTLLEPLHPAADQDGFDGEWKCRDANGLLWAVPSEALNTQKT